MGNIPGITEDEACQHCGNVGYECERCCHVVCSAYLVEYGDCPICDDFCPMCVIRLDEEQEENAEPQEEMEPCDHEPVESE